MVYEDLKKEKASFMALRTALAFQNVKLSSEAARVVKVVKKFPCV